MNVVRVAAWGKFDWLRHGFSTRAGGHSTVYHGKTGAKDVGEPGESAADLNLGFTKEDAVELVERNRADFLSAVAGVASHGAASEGVAELATVRQVHGTCVQVVRQGGGAGEADGLITQTAGVMLGIQVADCVPVLLADTRQRVVAALHAGWRGTTAGIVNQGIAAMRSECGARLEDLTAAVGPAIGACCYTIGDEVHESFTRRYAYATTLFAQRQDGLHLDLAEANRRQLLDAGVRASEITLVGECTACTRIGGRRKYFSHRAEHGFTGRAMGMIGIQH